MSFTEIKLRCVHSKMLIKSLFTSANKTIFRMFNYVFYYKNEPIKKIKNLQGQGARRKCQGRTSQSTCGKGALTVEAALVFPLFLFAVYAVILISRMMLSSAAVDWALGEAARNLAKTECRNHSESSVTEVAGDFVSGSAYVVFQRYLDSSRLTGITGGCVGVVVRRIEKETQPDYVILRAKYRCVLPAPLLGDVSIPREETVAQRIFNGYDTQNGWDDKKYVYVAEYESVYHLYADCSHIAIRVMSSEQADRQTGLRRCRHCCSSGAPGNYVTVCGECIHWDSDCSSLRRTVHLKKRTEVEGLPLCSRCRARQGTKSVE